VYNEIPQEEANNTDLVLTCEVPMKQALTGPDAGDWLSALVKEMKSILKNDTWILANRPRDIHVIGSRMVLRNKYRADGTFERRKARLVAQGFSQKPGIHLVLFVLWPLWHGKRVSQWRIGRNFFYGSIERIRKIPGGDLRI
jgi:hypothetical protein